jgi:hypothetical protein
MDKEKIIVSEIYGRLEVVKQIEHLLRIRKRIDRLIADLREGKGKT